MLDPYIRTTLKKKPDSPTFYAEFKVQLYKIDSRLVWCV